MKHYVEALGMFNREIKKGPLLEKSVAAYNEKSLCYKELHLRYKELQEKLCDIEAELGAIGTGLFLAILLEIRKVPLLVDKDIHKQKYWISMDVSSILSSLGLTIEYRYVFNSGTTLKAEIRNGLFEVTGPERGPVSKSKFEEFINQLGLKVTWHPCLR